MRRESYRKIYNRLFRGLFDTIFQIRLFAADLKQRLDASGVSRCLIPLKRISGKAHDAASFGDVAEFCGEIEKSGLVFDDVLIETFHGETPWAWCPVDGAFALPSKRNSPSFSMGDCQIKSRLPQVTVKTPMTNLIALSGGDAIYNLGYLYALALYLLGAAMMLFTGCIANNISAKRRYPLF